VPAAKLRSHSCISFIDAHRGWALSNIEGKGRVLRASDGGRTWSIISTLKSGHPGWSFSLPSKIVFTDQVHGWIIETFSAWYTLDGGLNWTEVTPPELKGRGQLVCEFFLNSLKGWAIGRKVVGHHRAGQSVDVEKLFRGIVLHTTNEGQSWQPVSVGKDELFFDRIYFTDVEHGWLLSRDNVYRTTDRGRTWQRVLNVPSIRGQ